MRTCRTRTSGAQRRLWWRKGVSTFQQKFRLPVTSTDHCCTVCGAYLFSTTPCVHIHAHAVRFSCPLTSSCLTWAALSQPQSCFGCSTRDDVSSLWLRGATTLCFFISWLFGAAVASHLPWSARTHPGQLEPTTLPLRRLAPVSCSVGLSPTLSLPFSLALPCSISPVAPLCSFPTVLYPLSLSLSLSRAQKKGVRVVRCISIPPGVRTILHGTEEVWCIH